MTKIRQFFLTDSPKVAFQKIQKAVTDSENKIYFSENKPGITNLLNIFMGLSGKNQEETLAFFHDKDYFFLKQTVGQIVADFLEEIQEKYQQNAIIIDALATIGAERAAKIANLNLNKIRKN
ncbi:hypothetical protein [Mycoplasma sp. 'Moose RK']|uniref:hypothetical protein n=1 Tax=Mycoplasma sp. 'Moose RK' TaxID=2780095 RepID=UPI00280A54AB|nr:hypothetical protein [Mycoplasma sp. 'Moose RK']